MLHVPPTTALPSCHMPHTLTHMSSRTHLTADQRRRFGLRDDIWTSEEIHGEILLDMSKPVSLDQEGKTTCRHDNIPENLCYPVRVHYNQVTRQHLAT